MKSGIYKITNLLDKKVYIGSSTSLYTRRANHFYSCKAKLSKDTCEQ